MESEYKIWDNQLGWLLPFHYDPYMSGYRLYTFGGTAGPDVSIVNLLHEVAHAVQCSIDGQLYRLDFDNYNLHFQKMYSLGDRLIPACYSPQATMLEAKVCGIQRVIMDDLGVDRKEGYYEGGYYQYYANILVDYMADAYRIPAIGNKKYQVVMRWIKKNELKIGVIREHWERVRSYIGEQNV